MKFGWYFNDQKLDVTYAWFMLKTSKYNKYTSCPKISDTLASNTSNSVCSSWTSTKYRTLHYLNITYCHTYYSVRTLLCVLSVTSLWCQSLFTLGLHLIRCYWPWDQAVAYMTKTKSFHRDQRWPLWMQILKTISEWLSPWMFHIL